MRGALLLVMAAVIGTLAAWTERVRAADREADPPVAPRLRRAPDGHAQRSARGRPRRAGRSCGCSSTAPTPIIDNSAKYQIPADLAAAIYDIALSEGIDPALGFQLVKIESNFKAQRAEPDGRDRLYAAAGQRRRASTSRA